jgi:hypothetical protein
MKKTENEKNKSELNAYFGEKRGVVLLAMEV